MHPKQINNFNITDDERESALKAVTWYIDCINACHAAIKIVNP
jgi:hypothetical protein